MKTEKRVVNPMRSETLLEACKEYAALGFCEEGEVYIVPVNFGYDMKEKS